MIPFNSDIFIEATVNVLRFIKAYDILLISNTRNVEYAINEIWIHRNEESDETLLKILNINVICHGECLGTTTRTQPSLLKQWPWSKY